MKVVTLFCFITIMMLLYVIIFTHANYSDILETKRVSRVWNIFSDTLWLHNTVYLYLMLFRVINL